MSSVNLLIAKLKDTVTTKITKTHEGQPINAVLTMVTKTSRLVIAILVMGMTIAQYQLWYQPNAYAKFFFHHKDKNNKLNLEAGDTKNIPCKGSSGDVTLSSGTTLKACGKSITCKPPSDVLFWQTCSLGFSLCSPR